MQLTVGLLPRPTPSLSYSSEKSNEQKDTIHFAAFCWCRRIEAAIKVSADGHKMNSDANVLAIQPPQIIYQGLPDLMSQGTEL